MAVFTATSFFFHAQLLACAAFLDCVSCLEACVRRGRNANRDIQGSGAATGGVFWPAGPVQEPPAAPPAAAPPAAPPPAAPPPRHVVGVDPAARVSLTLLHVTTESSAADCGNVKPTSDITRTMLRAGRGEDERVRRRRGGHGRRHKLFRQEQCALA